MQEIQCNTVYMQGYFYVIFTFYIFKHKSKKGQKFPCLQYATAMNSRCAIKCNKIEVLYTGTHVLVPIFMSCLALRKECTS